MIPDVTNTLTQKEPSELHKALLTHAMALVKMSRAKMSKHYSDWDMQDQVYRGERYPDEKDVKAASKDEPIKMVVPHTFAQTMTFTSFLFLMFTQNRTFFELLPSGDEDYGTKQQDCETVMEHDLRRSQWNTVLFQHLLDTARFGPAITECSWTRKVTHAYVTPEPTMQTYNGVEVPVREGSSWQDYVKYEGNLVRAVSPYRFFPDTRFPLSEFQRGEFCAAEEEYSISSLRELEKAGEVAGVDHIQPLPRNWEATRGGNTRTTMEFRPNQQGVSAFLHGPSQSEGTVIVTKMQVWLVPDQFKMGPNDKRLGPETFPILYHLWYANDNRVIRCEPAYWWHNEFGWSVSQFTPDMHHTVSTGLADLIYRLQDVITWHINARITDVRRNLRGRFIVDQTGLEMGSVDGDGDIYLRKSAAKSGVDRWIKQLAVNDVTQSHMQDAEILGKVMEIVTGVNNNAMGQYNSGRRSAQESRTVTAGAAGRMKLHGQLIWDNGIAPLGRKMLSNSRQSLPFEQFGRIVGLNDGTRDEELQARYAKFKGTPEEVICGEDYITFDGTLSSEKGFMAQSLQELLSVVLQSDPAAAARMAQGIDPVRVVEEMQYLRGAGNIKRFRYTPEEQQQIQAMQQAIFDAQNKPQPKPPSESLNYKDAPPDIQRQIEAAAGLEPSKMPTATETGAGANGKSGGVSMDRSTHLTVHNKGNEKK